jgi:hypothetical protein
VFSSSASSSRGEEAAFGAGGPSGPYWSVAVLEVVCGSNPETLCADLLRFAIAEPRTMTAGPPSGLLTQFGQAVAPFHTRRGDRAPLDYNVPPPTDDSYGREAVVSQRWSFRNSTDSDRTEW